MVESLLGEREYTAPPSLDDRPSGDKLLLADWLRREFATTAQATK
jgi:hypothetical protein